MAEDDDEVVISGSRSSRESSVSQFYAGFGGTAADNFLLAQYFAAQQAIPEVVVRAEPKPAPAPPPPSRPGVVDAAPQIPVGPEPGEPLEEVVVRAEKGKPVGVVAAAAPAPAPSPAPRPRPRRSPPPKPTRTRPRRPTRTKPTVPQPRIPIKLPPLPEVVVRATAKRLVPVLTLVGPFLTGLAMIDQAAQEIWNDRLYGGDPRERDEDQRNERLGDPDARAARDRAARTQSPEPATELDVPEIVVTGRSPSPVPAPSPVPVPFIDYGLDALPQPQFDLSPQPGGKPVSEPARQPTPSSPFATPAPAPAPFPELFPSPAPLPYPSPAPSPRPRPGTPKPSLDPVPDPIIGSILPLPELGPVPVADLDRCKCPKPSKKLKKRKPRTECHRGTYVEKTTGLVKTPKEKVPCQ